MHSDKLYHKFNSRKYYVNYKQTIETQFISSYESYLYVELVLNQNLLRLTFERILHLRQKKKKILKCTFRLGYAFMV